MLGQYISLQSGIMKIIWWNSHCGATGSASVSAVLRHRFDPGSGTMGFGSVWPPVVVAPVAWMGTPSAARQPKKKKNVPSFNSSQQAFSHSFTQEIFIECLLCTRQGSKGMGV